MKGYKVVSKENGEYFSAFTSIGRIKYNVGRKTERVANQGPLAVFKHIIDAEMFHKLLDVISCTDIVIFRCNCEISEDEGLWTYPGNTKTDVPSGTRFANWVELIERV